MKLSSEEALELILWKEIRREIVKDIVETGGKNLHPMTFENEEDKKAYLEASSEYERDMMTKFEQHKKELGYDEDGN